MRQSNLFWLIVTALVAVCGMQPLVHGQDATPAKPAAKQTNRLPPYYKTVVNEEQRQKIYGIQEKYKDRLAALAEQVKKLQAERSAEIEALLSAEQKQKLADAKNTADKKKTDKTAAAKTTEVTKPADVKPEVKVEVKPTVGPAPVKPPVAPTK